MNKTGILYKLAFLSTHPFLVLSLVVAILTACAVQTIQRLGLSPRPITTIEQLISETDTNLTLSTSKITAMNLFGADLRDDAVIPSHEEISETNLALILKGAFSHSVAERASALIATDNNKSAKLYSIGEELPGNATLKEVHTNFVVLSRNGRLEKLLFFRNRREAGFQNNAVYSPPPTLVSTSTEEQYSAQSNTTSSFSTTSISEIRERLRKQAEQSDTIK